MIESHKAKHFDITELVPQTVHEARGEKAWQLIDIRLIANLDALRAQLKVPMTINNWNSGGDRTQSGLRIVGQPHYKPFSQHSFGRAADVVCSVPAKAIRDRIRSRDIVLPHPATFEEGDNITWLHMDVRNMSNDHTYFFQV